MAIVLLLPGARQSTGASWSSTSKSMTRDWSRAPPANLPQPQLVVGPGGRVRHDGSSVVGFVQHPVDRGGAIRGGEPTELLGHLGFITGPDIRNRDPIALRQREVDLSAQRIDVLL